MNDNLKYDYNNLAKNLCLNLKFDEKHTSVEN